MRTNSILSYILLSLEEAGYTVNSISTYNDDKTIKEPTEINDDKYYGVSFDKTKADSMLLNDEIEYTIEDKGLKVDTNQGEVKVEFNPARFRPAEVPILFSNTEKIQKLGAKTEHSVSDIIKDQLNFYLNRKNQ